MKEEIGFVVESLRPYGMTQSTGSSTGAEWVHVNFIAKIPKMIKLKPSEEGEFHWVDPAEVGRLDMVSD